MFSNSNERWIVRKVKKKPTISVPKLATEVSKDLEINCNPETIRLVLQRNKFHGRVARKKPYISKLNRTKRLHFAKTYIT
jgi:Transposase